MLAAGALLLAAFVAVELRAQDPVMDVRLFLRGTFARANLLVCRSGASTVAEVTAAGKPAVFIPFPRAADDHQRRNAEAISAAGAAVLLPESDLTPQGLAQTIAQLLSDRARLQEMSRKANALSHEVVEALIAAVGAMLASVMPVAPVAICEPPTAAPAI